MTNKNENKQHRAHRHAHDDKTIQLDGHHPPPPTYRRHWKGTARAVRHHCTGVMLPSKMHKVIQISKFNVHLQTLPTKHWYKFLLIYRHF